MDQGKLLEVRTFSQTFANNPNEKFLLMILCSQAKLESDNRGINVKRGIRAKCEMGWRPGMPPLGYYNRAFNGLKDIMVDEKRAKIIKEMFYRVAQHGQSGRTIKLWLDKIGFKSRTGGKVTLSQVYIMIKNPFYYGEFEYPTGSGKLFKGSHQPLISKKIFDKVQKKLIVPQRSKWGAKEFPFKGLIACASCGSGVVGEEKIRKLNNNGIKKHIYYHCSRSKNFKCKERYLREELLIKELVSFIGKLNLKHFEISKKLKRYITEYQRITKIILRQQKIESDQNINLKSFSKYVLKDGSNKEKRELLKCLQIKLYLKNRTIIAKQ